MAQKLHTWFVDCVARNFRLPKRDLFGWLACKYFEQRNHMLEVNAVRLSNIKPDHKVLEIGFGPGLGLEAAYDIVKNGKGQVFGIDTSFYMVQTAKRRLKKGIQDNKVFLYHGSASQIPLNTDSIHRVFHCNSYYFWPSMRSVMREIYRVMQPGSTMVTTINFAFLKKTQERGFLKYGHPDPVKYMRCLENYGFENVHLEYHTDSITGKQFQAIVCSLLEKPAHDILLHSDDDDDNDEENVEGLEDTHKPENKQLHFAGHQFSETELSQEKKT